MAHSFDAGTCCWGGLGRPALPTDGASPARPSRPKRLKENDHGL